MGVDVLREIVAHDQVWPKMAAKYGVENPVPPWKTSLDGLCDALDRAACVNSVPTFQERRDEEDALAATVYADLPTPRANWSHWPIPCSPVASSPKTNWRDG